jgi:iron complex transport system substrate-binding protein
LNFRWHHFQFIAAASGLLVILALCGCGPVGRIPEGSAATQAIKDSTGREVTIPAQPRRVLSLCTAATDTMVRLGRIDRLAGMDEYSGVVPGTSNVAVLGKGSALSREQVLARQIDLAFVWWFQDDAAKLLDDLRVPVVKLRCGRAVEVPDTIRLVGRCLGETNVANALAQSVAGKLAQIIPADTNMAPRVYVELYSPFKTSGRDTYLNDLIELAGGRNVAAEATGTILLSSERLLAADPQWVILIAGFGTPEQFTRRGGMESLVAVKAGRVQILDRYHLVAGAGLPEGVAALHRLFNHKVSTQP